MALHSILSVSVLLTVMEVVSALSTQVHGSYEDSNTARQVQRQQPANRLNDYQALLAHHLLSKLNFGLKKDKNVESKTKALNSGLGQSLPTLMLNIARPTVEVLVRGEHFHESIDVALMPDMSTYDSINAAKNLYQYRYPGEMLNPFRVNVRIVEEKRCAVIDAVAGYQADWHVQITNHLGQIIHHDQCIPRKSQMKMRPAYKVLVTQLTSANS